MNKEGKIVLLGIICLIVIFCFSFVSATSGINQVSDVNVPIPVACEHLINTTHGNLMEIRLDEKNGAFYFKYGDDRTRFSIDKRHGCFVALKNILKSGDSLVGNIKIVDSNSLAVAKLGITGNVVASKKKVAATTTPKVTKTTAAAKTATTTPKVTKTTAAKSVKRTKSSSDGTVTTATGIPQIDSLVDFRGYKYIAFDDGKRSNFYIREDGLVYLQRPSWGGILTDWMLPDKKLGEVITNAGGSFVKLDIDAKDYMEKDILDQLNGWKISGDLSAPASGGLIGSVKSLLNVLNGKDKTQNIKDITQKILGVKNKTSASKIDSTIQDIIKANCNVASYSAAHPNVCNVCTNAKYAKANPTICNPAGDCNVASYAAAHPNVCTTVSGDCSDPTYAAVHVSACGTAAACLDANYAATHTKVCSSCTNPSYVAANPGLCGGTGGGDCSDPTYAAVHVSACGTAAACLDANYASAHPKVCGNGGTSSGGGTATCAQTCSQQCGSTAPQLMATDSSSSGGGMYTTNAISGNVVSNLPVTNNGDCYTSCMADCRGGGTSSGGGTSGGGGSGGGTSGRGGGGGASGGGTSGRGGGGGASGGGGSCKSTDPAQVTTVTCKDGTSGTEVKTCQGGQYKESTNTCNGASIKDCTSPTGKDGSTKSAFAACPADGSKKYPATCTGGSWVPNMNGCASKACTNPNGEDGSSYARYGVCPGGDGSKTYPATCNKGAWAPDRSVCTAGGDCTEDGNPIQNGKTVSIPCGTGDAMYDATCTDGQVTSNKAEKCGSGGCEDGGKTYQEGETWTDQQGKCNICSDGVPTIDDSGAECNNGCEASDGQQIDNGNEVMVDCINPPNKQFREQCNDGVLDDSDRETTCKCESAADCEDGQICSDGGMCLCDDSSISGDVILSFTGKVISPFTGRAGSTPCTPPPCVGPNGPVEEGGTASFDCSGGDGTYTETCTNGQLTDSTESTDCQNEPTPPGDKSGVTAHAVWGYGR